MRRPLLNLMTAASLLACAATAGAWVRSHHRCDQLRWQWRELDGASVVVGDGSISTWRGCLACGDRTVRKTYPSRQDAPAGEVGGASPLPFSFESEGVTLPPEAASIVTPKTRGATAGAWGPWVSAGRRVERDCHSLRKRGLAPSDAGLHTDAFVACSRAA